MTDTDFSPELRHALDELGAGLEQTGRALRRIASAGRAGARGHPAVDADVARLAQRLAGRLGEKNRAFVWRMALEFEPGEEFTFAELAKALDITPEHARARLMNIGRSLKSLGGRGVLWEADWDDEAGIMQYSWTYQGHEAVLQEFGE